METVPLRCPSCDTEVTENAFFCSNCGRSLKARPESVSVGRQVFIYLVSFFLAPLGLVFAWKYLKMSDVKSKRIGFTVIALTILAVIAVFLTAKTFLQMTYGNIMMINSLLY